MARLTRAGAICLRGIPLETKLTRKRTERMWKIVITEIQDANTLDPMHAPPGAFFVSTERFARTVEHLDLPNIISVINRMQSSPRGHARDKRELLSEKIPHLETNRLAAVEHLA
jgi:hypothetical protein